MRSRDRDSDEEQSEEYDSDVKIRRKRFMDVESEEEGLYVGDFAEEPSSEENEDSEDEGNEDNYGNEYNDEEDSEDDGNSRYSFQNNQRAYSVSSSTRSAVPRNVPTIVFKTKPTDSMGELKERFVGIYIH
jgi:hypothetical protein